MTYEHGGELLRAAKKATIKPGQIIDFSVSVNPKPLSDRTAAAIAAATKDLSAYPDVTNTKLKEAIAKAHSINAENILPGNGSTELIYLITQALSLQKRGSETDSPDVPATRLKKALIVEPAFSEYCRALKINGFNVSHFSLSGDFILNTEKLLSHTLKNGFDLLFLANPANPTGQLIDRTSILRLANGLEGSSTQLVLDEAFIDFTDKTSIIKNAAELNNTILLRSMTKFYSLAGLRLGFIVTNTENIKKISSVQPPWSINSVASAAAAAVLKEDSFKEQTKTWFKTERTRMTQELSAVGGLKVYPSAANFLMIEITMPGITAGVLQERLLKENFLLIRSLDNFTGLGAQFFRIAVKEPVENRLLCAALKELLKPTAL